MSIWTDIVGFVCYAISLNGILFTTFSALTAFGAIGLSTTEATLTKHVGSDRAGELMSEFVLRRLL